MGDAHVFDEDLLIEGALAPIVPSIEPPWVPKCVFPTRDDLLNWAWNVGKVNGYVLVIGRSDKGETGGLAYVTLLCERHGVYKPYNDRIDFVYRKTSSKKIACRFRLKGRPIKDLGGGWILRVKCGLHNHAANESLVGHSYAGRLTKEEKSLVVPMSKNWVAPRNMLNALRKKYHENKSTITQVYIACKTWRRDKRGPLTEMHELMKKMQDGRYVHYERTEEGSDNISEVFWAHLDSIKLLNAFPDVVIMDSTYKTNRYRIPLFEMVGFTSTSLTFCIAFCYMTHERAENYICVLECLKSLISKPAIYPKILVTDKAMILLRVVAQIFPTSTHLLCRSHINKMVEAKCKVHVGTGEFHDEVIESWKGVIDATTVQEYEKEWRHMSKICKDFPLFPAFTFYLHTTWLAHKEKFVKAWTNSVMHFGTLTSNRVESAHATFKTMLRNSKGDFCESWDAAHRLIIVQHNAITASFETSIHIFDHCFKDPYFANVNGFVSKKCLQIMWNERERNNEYDEACGCFLKVTHGLSYRCALDSFEQIPYEVVHPFWKRLSWAEVAEPVADEHMSAVEALHKEFDDLMHFYVNSDETCQSMIRRKIKQIYIPESSTLGR